MNGNLCSYSTGEALSRWCAAVIGNNALSDFTTAPTWFHDGMPNYVDQTDPSDGNADSTGCGMAFLSWLMSLGTSLDKTAQAMVALGDGGNLAQLYAKLTGDWAANAWHRFTDAVNALPGGVTSDDPFGGAMQLPRHKLRKIVERDMPGFTIAEPEPAAADTHARPEATPEEVTPEIAELRRKFLGADADTNAPFYGADSNGAGEDDSAIVLTRPIQPPSDVAAGGLGPKAVVISHGKVIAKQG
jgi:hypothetical protein